MEACVFIQIDSKGAADSIYLCTGSYDLDKTQMHGGVSTRTYLAGRVFEMIRLEQSTDISGGKGFMSAAPTGTLRISDSDGTLAAAILNETWSAAGGMVYIGCCKPDGVIHKLYQLAIVEPGTGANGSVELVCRGASALSNHLMHKSAAVSQLLTDPDDPANPTDPTYMETKSANVMAGTALGGVPVSLKAGDPLPVCRLTRWDNTTLRTGDISGAGQVAFIASAVGSQFVRQHVGVPADPDLREAGSLIFRCRATESGGSIDLTQAELLKDTLDAFVAAGYKIILSNGSWFCDILAEPSWVGEIDLGDLFYHTTAGGEYYGVAGYYDAMWTVPALCGVWFCLTNQDFEDLAPLEDLDPTTVGIYAVPKTLPIASAQVLIDGFARNKRTAFAAGDSAMVSGVQMFGPTVSNESSLIAVSAVKDFHLAFSASTLPALDHTGAIENPLADGDSLMSGSGDVASIKSDPTDGWNGGTAPVWFQGTTRGGSLADMWGRVKCSPAQLKIDADFLSIENTWRATYTASSGGFTRTFACAAVGPLEKAPTQGPKHIFPPGEVFVRSKTATRAPKNPRWERTFASLDDMRDNLTPMIRASGPLAHMQSIKLELMESFLYAYSKFGFSSIYSTVYPFWTRKSCASLAYGAGTLIAGGVGRGTAIQPSGAITWAPFDLPVPVGGVAAVAGTAYGNIGGDPLWMAVGYIASGATNSPACWISWDDGITWYQNAAYQTAAVPTCVRFVNSKFVVTRTDGSIDIADHLLLASLVWVHKSTGATQLNDIAFGAGRYLMVGDGGQARYSSDLVTFSDWAYPAGDDLLCVAYSQSSIGGFFHVGYRHVGGVEGGTIFRMYDNTTPSWSVLDLPSGDAVRAIASAQYGDIVAVTGAGVWARSQGYTDPSWKFRLNLGGNDSPMGAVAFTIGGSPLVVVGGPAQIATSPFADQGALADATGLIPEWTPWATKSAGMALDFLANQFLGGTRDNLNPIRYSGRAPIYQAFGIAFDPPSTSDTTSSDDPQAGTTALQAARTICEEWWIFAGEMPAAKLDGSADAIQAALPDVKPGNYEDVYTQITVQYKPFGGEYLGRAYIQNVDVAYVAGNDEFYFAGWDVTGNAVGLALWTACRNAHLATGILRETSRTYDSVQDAGTMGALWNLEDLDLGWRILWLCKQPRYYRITVDGNDSAAALAFNGCRYKPNPLFLTQRGLSLGITGYGVVVENSHNPVSASHELLIAFPPEQP